MTDDKKKNPLSDFMRERASVVISDLDGPGGLDIGEALAWRHWFAERQRQLQSSGGRPTNPDWTMKRQIPLSPETWAELRRRAETCSTSDSKLGPGQVAAFILEEAVEKPTVRAVREGHLQSAHGVSDLDQPTDDPQFDNWDSPAPFFPAAA